MAAPFHTALAYFAKRSRHPNTQTIRLQDSLSGNVALGLDFPVAVAIAIIRHFSLKNTSILSLDIHIPSVKILRTPFDAIDINEKKQYTRSEIVAAAKPKGFACRIDAYALWSLASDVKTGLLDGADVVKFQQGTLFETIERRRKSREQVLPLYRGGPIWIYGHSWFVKTVFGVDVYQQR